MSLLTQSWSALKGRKTYLAAGLLALWGLVGAWAGLHSWDEGWQLVLQAAGLAGLRNALVK